MKTFKKIVSVALVATMFLGVSQLPMSVAAATQNSTTATEQATVQTESKQSNTVELNSVVEDTTQSEPATAAATTQPTTQKSVAAAIPKAYRTASVSGDTYYGECGKNVTWSLSTTTNTLTISGEGAMANYSSTNNAPWKPYKDYVKTVVIEDGVTSIGADAFFLCTSLASITIPDSITSIGSYAFHVCTSLASITIPDSVTSIGSSAFSGCTSLASITIPNSVKSIGYSAFYDCTSLASITIPNSVTSIGYSAFRGCTSLASITIPDSVTSIGDSAFSGCTTLASITIPDSVTSIGAEAFYGCTSLEKIEIPVSVTSIGEGAFSRCKNVTIYAKTGSYAKAFADRNSIAFVSTGIYNDTGSCGENVTYYIDSVNKVMTISGKGAMANYSSAIDIPWNPYRDYVKTVVIEDGVTSIGDYAFRGCTSLASITISDSVTSIGSSAFYVCTSLASITIPDSVTSIGYSAFRECTALASITIPNSVKSIGDSAFSECTSLASITIPDSVTSIGYYSFNECTALASITIPNSVKSIGGYAFYRCTALASITIPDSVTSIGDSVFSGCTALASITIPDSVTSIGKSAFYGCTSLASITIPDSVASIGYSAFSECTSLASITIPDSVTSIGDSAFSECTSLASITILDGVASIGGGAFSRCTSLASITIPDSVTSIGGGAFSGCTSLASITIPDSVKLIDSYAFSGCTSLASITIPNSVKSIGCNAFYGCTSLASITIPDGVTSIGYEAFSKCTTLEKIEIPVSVTSIDYYAFSGSKNVTIYAKTGSYAKIFADRKSIAFVSTGIYNDTGSCGENVTYYIDSVNNVMTISGKGAMANYLSTSVPWELYMDYVKTVVIEDGVTSIGSNAFYGNTSLQTATIPESVTKIGNNAFARCDSLTIFGSYGTAAFDYAHKNSVKFMPISGTGTGIITATFDCESNIYRNLTLKIYSDGEAVSSRKITDSKCLSMYGIDDTKTYSAKVVSADGYVFETVNNIVFENGIAEITFKCTNKPHTASAVVKDTDGKVITNNVAVKWTKAENSELISQSFNVNSLYEGEKITCELVLGDSMLNKYEQPKPVSIVVGEDNTVEFTLKKISRYSTTINVKNSDGTALSYADVVITQSFGKNKVVTSKITDANGTVTVDLSSVDTEIVVSANGYFDYKWNGTISENGSVDVNLNELNGGKIYYTLKEITTNGNSVYISSNSFNMTLFNVTSNAEIKNVFVQNGKIYFNESDVNDGDKLKLSIKHTEGIYADGNFEFTYSSSERNLVEAVLVRKGSIKINAAPSSNDNNVALLFNSNGKYVASTEVLYSSLFAGLNSGEYTVVVIGANSYTSLISSYDKLKKYGLTENKDFVKYIVSVEDGKTSKINDITVPVFDAENFNYLNSDKAMVSTSVKSVALGNYFVVKAEYSFDNAFSNMASNQKVIINIPENCQFMNDSITVDGKTTGEYRVFDDYIEVSTNNSEGTVRFCLVNIKPQNSTVISASVAFDMDGNSFEQPIGSTKIDLSELDFNVPSAVCDDSLVVYGNTYKDVNINIYDNNVKVASCTSNKAGAFSTEIKLHNAYLKSTHNIYAVVNVSDDLILTSQTKTVEYSVDNVVPSKIFVEYLTTNYVIDLINTPLKSPNCSFNPAYPTMTFSVEFLGDTTKLSNVQVVTTNSDGSETVLDTVFDNKTERFVCSGDFSSKKYPKNITVKYDCETNKDVIDLNTISAKSNSFVENTSNEVAELLTEAADNDEIVKMYLDNNNYTCTKYDSNDYSYILRYNKENTYKQMDCYHYGIYVYSMILEQPTSTPIKLENAHVIYQMVDKGSSVESNYSYSINPSAGYSSILDKSTNTKLSYVLSPDFVDYENTVDQPQNLQAEKDMNNSVNALPEQLNKAVNNALSDEMNAQSYNESDDNISPISNTKRTVGSDDVWELFTGDSALEAIAKYNAHMESLEGCIEQKGGKLSDYPVQSKGEFYTILALYSLQNLGNFASNITSIPAYAWFVFTNGLSMINEELGNVANIMGYSYDLSIKNTLGALKDKTNSFNIKDVGKNYSSVASSVLLNTLYEENANIVNGMLSDLSKAASDCWQKPNPNDFSIPGNINIALDPSGYVYEGVASNRVEGVTCTVYYSEKADGSNAVVWNAEEYGQQNPLVTDANGYYEWYVPQGYWQVKYEKDGYLTTYSDWLPVPPPQTEVNIGITSTEAPTVENVYAYNDAVQINFSQYMNIYSVTDKTVTITMNGEKVNGTIKPLNAEKGENQAILYANKFMFTPEKSLSDKVNVSVSGVRNYAEAAIDGTYSQDYTVVLRPEKINVEAEQSVEYGKTKTIEIQVTPAQAAANKTVFVESSLPNVVGVSDSEITTDENGKATIVVNAMLPGSAEITFKLANSDLSASTIVNSKISDKITVEPVTASIKSNTTVESGTTVTLSTTTEGAEIYYTTDLSCPCIVDSPSRIKYTAPIVITKDTYIIAYAVKDGCIDSKTALFIYKVAEPKPTGIYGDLNADNIVTIADVTILQCSLADCETPSSYSDLLADVNRDGKINVNDVTTMQYYLADYSSGVGYCGKPYTEEPPTEPTTVQPNTVA